MVASLGRVFDPDDPGPDYQLAWPGELFRAEATAILRYGDDSEWLARAELLLEEAFAGRGPRSDLDRVRRLDERTVTRHGIIQTRRRRLLTDCAGQPGSCLGRGPAVRTGRRGPPQGRR